ncbi:MAG: AAA family ATPase [Chloroflexi bacterium]|nr:AAA family ATPase [Chloroflexota bacterium]
MSTLLEIHTLGGLKIELDGHLLSGIATRKAEALLVVLAHSGRPLSRETLAELFWPERPRAQALSSMRATLSRLRKRLSSYVTATQHTISINVDSPYWLDVLELEEQLAQVSATSPLSRAEADVLAHAAALYQGDFLEGFFVRGSPGFEAWARDERERLRRAIIEALRRLVRYELEHDRIQAGILHAAQLLDFDPLHEETHRHLMHLLALAGQRSEALHQFETCRQRLDEELGVEPDAETVHVYESIRSGEGLTVRPMTRPRHNLPAQLTPFVGREHILSQLMALLAQDRLVTLIGPGGIGKTRLALEFAAQRVPDFEQGVFFVALVGVSSPDSILSAIADAIGYQPQQDRRSLQQQLCDHLADQHMLLVLDNFEHLIEHASLVADLLQHAPEVSALVTSREQLNLAGERILPVGGLELPETETTDDLLRYSAIRLFMQSAWHARPDFDPEAHRLQHAVRICQLVDGVPLAVLLAASWIDTLSLRDIANEIERGLDFLAAELRNMPERHRSLRAVFASSWERLSDTERDVLMRLSVFRGSLLRQAAQQVTGASLHTLKSLLNKSLLRRDSTSGRYDIHEMVRQFAHDHLVLCGDADTTRDLHAQYYVAFLNRRRDDLKGQRQREALDEIEADFDNIQAAWRWAAAQQDAATIQAGLESLYLFCRMRSRWDEGRQLMQAAVDHFATSAPRLGAALQARAINIDDPAEYDDAVTQLEQLLVLAREVDDRFETAFCLMQIGCARLDVSTLQESLTLFQELGQPYYCIGILHQLGYIYGNQGDKEACLHALHQSYDLACEVGDKIEGALAILMMGSLELWREGNYRTAIDLFSEARRIQSEMRNQSGVAANEAILGRISFLLGDFADARQRSETALNLANAINHLESKIFALSTRGLLAAVEGRIDDAVRDCQTAFQVYPDHPVTLIIGNLGLAVANLALDRRGTARTHFKTGLKHVTQAVFTAAQTWFLPVAAVLSSDHPERAVELLALALTHPKSATGWVEHWDQISQLRANLEHTLSPDTFAAVWEHGQTLVLEDVVRELL